MKKILNIATIAMTALLMSGCQFGDNFGSFDFDAERPADAFRVYEHHVTDLSNGLPEGCYMPDGEMIDPATLEVTEEVGDAACGPMRTTSTTGTNAVQQLLLYNRQTKILEMSGTYMSIDVDGNPIRLSGKVMVPLNKKKQAPRRYILVSHYTTCANFEAPSNTFSLEGLLCGLGYVLIIPDYLGYGVTADHVHPYLVMDLTARNVTDMFFAVQKYLEGSIYEPYKEDIYLMGYSQGGATTMAVEWFLETKHPEVLIHRVFAGGGPYDVKATYDRFVETDVAGYPVAVPLVLQGMIVGNKLDLKMEEMMSTKLYSHLDEWVNSKKYSSAQINTLIDSHVTHDLLSDISMNRQSREVGVLYKAMTENSIVSYHWSPKAPVYMMHSIDDETVPYVNATRAKAQWSDANIQVNFGHYGGHVPTCLRFISSVWSLLKQAEKEEDDGIFDF